ncbi:MAG: CPBP family intramembrane metalloprotease [Bacilli bacterium]|nr:CPBP family intramembrane metalloprotease [Bacilli bacterium]
MKKRIWFIVVSILLIIINIFTIINAQDIINETLGLLNELPIKLDERLVNIYSNTKIVIVPAVICIIANIIPLLIGCLNKVEGKRNLLLAMFIINIIFSNSSLANLFSFISIVVCVTIKNVKIKHEMPMLNRIDDDNKSLLIGILMIGVYFSQLLFNFISIDSFVVALIIDFLVNIFMMGFCIFLFRKNLKRDIKYLKDNFRGYISFIAPKLGVAYIIYIIVSLISSIICGGSTSINQEIINKMPLYYTLPLAIIIAPITEEIIFRGCIRRLIKNDKLFIVLSGLIFGLLHMMHEVSLLNAIVLCAPYALLGGIFAYIYTKTNNISTTIMCHSFHNTVVMLLQILLLY